MTKDQEIEMLKAQLAEAVGLIKALTENPYYADEFLEADSKAQAFLARHAQAQPHEARLETLGDILNSPCAPCEEEAQGAQAGDLASTVRVLLEVPQLQGEQAFSAQPIIDRVRAALATQPADGEPVYQYMGLCNEWIECKKSSYEYQQKCGHKVRTLWTAAPVAAGEPVAWECFDGRYASLSYEREGDPERAVPLFRGAPPAAAHGDKEC